jgi:hypothetical protein
MKKSTRKLIGFTFAVIFSLCCICLVIAYAVYSSESIIPTPAPVQSFDTPLPLEIIIAQTSSAAQTQTQQAMPPVSLPTATLAPAIESTATVFISVLQTNNAAQPTEYIFSTNTPYSLVTQAILATQEIQSTLPPQSGVCSCSGDTLNCNDFSSHAAAQSCFDYCMSQGAGDMHKLDQNNDNNACESLP